MSYSYSPKLRAVEIAGLITFAAVGLGFVASSAADIARAPWWLSVFAALAGYVGADLMSGLVHFLADNFGSVQTPIWGEAFVKPFREHHVDPKGICTHDFVELSGTTAVGGVVVLLLTLFALPFTPESARGPVALFVVVWLVGLLATNLFHRWSHADNPPPVARLLQRLHVVLTPQMHDRHHTVPFTSSYCITTGWFNPLLDKCGVFSTLERWLRGASPKTAHDVAASPRTEP